MATTAAQLRTLCTQAWVAPETRVLAAGLLAVLDGPVEADRDTLVAQALQQVDTILAAPLPPMPEPAPLPIPAVT